jgi:diphthamide biosynthesis protein 2
MAEKAKDAEVIGILVGTLGATSYLEQLDYLRQLIKHAGKRHFTVAVGKLNPAKLANLSEIDAFVYVACPESCLVLDSKEYLRPIVTPYELTVALSPNSTWFPQAYNTQFANTAGINAQRSADDDVPTFSLATGKLTRHSNHTTQNRGLYQSGTKDLVNHDAGDLIVSNTAVLSKDRTWFGLSAEIDEDASVELYTGKYIMALIYLY